MNPRDVRLVSAHSAPAFEVSMVFAVEDAQALWGAAVERAVRIHGMAIEDVLDTLGPREDPSLAECLSMLVAPIAPAGCSVETYRVEPVEPVLAVVDAAERLGGWPAGAAA